MTYDFTAERSAYNILRSVLHEGAYSTIALDRALAVVGESYKGRVTALVYGVLEHNVTIDYYISVLVTKKPKSNIELLLKMAISDLIDAHDPDYAIINRYVQFVKEQFNGAHSFINAVLKHVSTTTLPQGQDAFSLSVRYSAPKWVVERLISDYGTDKSISILSAKLEKKTHIRYNARLTNKLDFERGLTKYGDICGTSIGYYVTRNTLIKLNERSFTAQSISSMKAAAIISKGLEHPKALDVCAAPGGKAIYIEELCGADVTACDIHQHRVELIRSYAHRMGSNVKAFVNDGTKLRQEWVGVFDLVMCDVPCSGSGLLKSSPDVLFSKSDSDITALGALQRQILEVSSKYVKPGGRLAYSTCSLFRAENDEITDAFSVSHLEFKCSGYTLLSPDTDACDGFFIARWDRVK